MAGLALLDETTAAVDLSLATRSTYGGTPGAALSIKSTLGYISLDVMRDMFDQNVFGSSGWQKRIPALKRVIGRADGYESKGILASDPLLYFANNFPQAIVFTADTSCTLSGDAFITRRHTGTRASANHEAGYDLESFGAWASSWITT